MPIDVDAYLDRIAFGDDVRVDLDSLEALQRAHLTTVPFENLDVYRGVDVRTDLEWSLGKVVGRRRGGWCFELNGAFSALLTAIGFEVRMLGAAVLLGGPNALIDHLTLEVTLDRAYLVDVGFGESFIRPLELNSVGPQDGGAGTFEFIASSEGTTLTRHDVSGIPEPQYRFSRVARTLKDFEPASERLRSDPELPWSQKPFATRLIDGGPDRVTLLRDRLKTDVAGLEAERPVGMAEWGTVLLEQFSMVVP